MTFPFSALSPTAAWKTYRSKARFHIRSSEQKLILPGRHQAEIKGIGHEEPINPWGRALIRPSYRHDDDLPTSRLGLNLQETACRAQAMKLSMQTRFSLQSVAPQGKL